MRDGIHQVVCCWSLGEVTSGGCWRAWHGTAQIRSRQAVHTDAQDPMPADAVVNLEEGDFLEGMQINSFTSNLGALLEPSEEEEEKEAYVTASDHERRMRGAHTSTSESTDGLRRSALFPTVGALLLKLEGQGVNARTS